MPDTPLYNPPGWFTRNLVNRAVRRLTRMGVSVAGSRDLRVRGRSTGEWRSTPVNVLSYDRDRYLIAPRGTTQWVRNLRSAGAGQLCVGRHAEAFAAAELADADKTMILREYIRRWKWEVGTFFPGLSAQSTDAELAAVAPSFPVFRIDAAAAG